MNRPERSAHGTADVCAEGANQHGARGEEIAWLLARLLAPYVAAQLSRAPADDWCDQATSPLGQRRHRELAKRGAFPAFKDGRKWRARRADVEAYIRAQRPGAPLDGAAPLAAAGAPPANDAAADDDPAVRAALAEVGLELAPRPARPGRHRR